MKRARDWLGGRGFRQRQLIAMVSGALATLAFAPVSMVPAVLPAFVVLVWLIAGTGRVREAAWLGLAFGFGHFMTGLYWITEAFYVVGGPAAVGAWPGVAGLSLYMACYPAATAALARRFVFPAGGGVSLWDIAAFSGIWTLAEWVRGWMFTGFPWNPMGNVWSVSDTMMQPAALFGVYGLSFFTVLAAAAPAGQVGRRWNGVILSLAVVILMWGGGAWRLSGAPAPGQTADSPAFSLRLVQPNIPQRLKWQPDLRVGHVENQVTMSRAPGAPDLVIWAETAIPFYVNGDAALLDVLRLATAPAGHFIAGGLRREGNDRFNSIFVIGGDGAIADTYDKVHLVPFGEYMPLADMLPFGKLTAGTVDFTPGRRFAPIATSGIPPFQPLICFEAIFPGSVVARDSPRPRWLLNLTNDAWYGGSAGPYQHFETVRMRAVEEGLPVVRVANTGISGIVDAYGRVAASLALSEQGVLDGVLPAEIAPTPFSRTGNATALILVIVVVVICVTVRRRRTD